MQNKRAVVLREPLRMSAVEEVCNSSGNSHDVYLSNSIFLFREGADGVAKYDANV